MKTVLYARVSTSDQTLAHQRTQAEAAGIQLDEVLGDGGVSGVSTTLSERPEGRRLYDLLREGDTLVVRWLDRLGRNYRDVSDAVREFMRRGVVVRTVSNNMTFDGSTKNPMEQAVRDALIAFMAATAEAQAEARRRPNVPVLPTPDRMTAAQNTEDENPPSRGTVWCWSKNF